MTKKLYIFFLLFIVSTAGFSQVEFEAKVNKKKIGVNERLRVDFEMNQNGDDFAPPDFDGFRVYGGPRQSISESWVNGTKSFSKTYSYYLEPEKRGTLTIGQASVHIGGKTYKTSPQEIEVTTAVDKPRDEHDDEIVDVSDDIHVVMEISKNKPYLNEGITVVYKLYVGQKASVSNWRVKDSPKFANFWSQDIDINDYKVKYGSYNGQKDYRYVELKKVVLYPQKSGELEIEPLSLDLAVEVPTNRRDIFGRPEFKSIEKTFSSKTGKLDVQPLPQEGRPNNFTGAVGDFDLAVTGSKDALEINESMDVKVEVSGKGNLKLFDLPELEVPSAFETYDPEHSENTQTDLSGMHGSVSDNYTLVANSGGKFSLEPVKFSYFDPKAKRYRTLTSDQIDLDVSGEESSRMIGGANSSDTSGAVSHKRKVTTAGKQFRYIKLRTKLHPIKQSPFFKSKLFWTLLFIPVVLIPVFVGFGRKYKERVNDIYGNRLRRADKLSRKYLSEAKKTLGDQTAYYEALERALHNFLKAKLDIQTSDLRKPKIKELMEEKGVTEETSQDFIKLLEACEFARYTPPSDIEMQQDYDKAADIISKVDKQMRA